MVSWKQRFAEEGGSSYATNSIETAADRASTGAFEALYSLQNPEAWASNPELRKTVNGAIGSLDAPASEQEILLLKSIQVNGLDAAIVSQQIAALMPGQRLVVGGVMVEISPNEAVSVSRVPPHDFSDALANVHEAQEARARFDRWGRAW